MITIGLTGQRRHIIMVMDMVLILSGRVVVLAQGLQTWKFGTARRDLLKSFSTTTVPQVSCLAIPRRPLVTISCLVRNLIQLRMSTRKTKTIVAKQKLQALVCAFHQDQVEAVA